MSPRNGSAALTARRGATAVMFALMVIPILGFVALAFDVGSVVWARSQLDLAADAAALTGATKGANDFAVAPSNPLTPAHDAAVQRFNAQASQLPGVSLSSLSVGVTNSGNKITAVVTYAAKYQTHFAGLFGFPTLPAGGTAAASRTNSPFFAINLLMDDSSSMAIGASPADMAKLGQLVHDSAWYKTTGQTQNCAFGCHFDKNNNDFYGLAHSNGVSLRIDILEQAVQNVIGTIAASPSAPQFSFGLYSFNATFNTVFAPSTDLAAAEAEAAAMTVPVTTDGGAADTNIPLALQQITALTPPAGDGSRATAPRRFLFIISDGIADYFNAKGVRTIAALDPTQCAALKAKGVEIMTLYTQYFPIEPPNVPTANAFYVANVKPFVGTLAANLQACASSPSLAFQASDAASIGVALQAMLQAALSAPAKFTE